MAPAGQTTIIRKKRRRRRRRTPIFPFVFVGLVGIGLFWGARLLIRKRPVSPSAASLPAGYVVEMSALRMEYSHYYGKPIEESSIERRFRQAAELIAKRDYPGAASTLETLSRKAALPVVFSNLGIVYSALGDYARSGDSFREVLARDADYAPARQFLKNTRSIPPNSADPYTREVEPNNEARTANLIGLGVPVSGEVTGNTDDVDYFRVITPAAPRDLLSVELAIHSIGFAPRLHIYDENLRLLSWGETTARSGDSIRVTGGPAPNSAVYVSVSPSDSRGGLYVLSVKPQKAFDRYEPNDDIMSSHRITMGEELAANIMDADDVDFFSFQSPRQGTVTIEIRNRSDSLIPGVTTFNTDRRNMGFGPEIRKPGLSLHHTIDVEKDRIYYIQVWSQAGSSGAYTLRVD
jgi:hypothetical protein